METKDPCKLKKIEKGKQKAKFFPLGVYLAFTFSRFNHKSAWDWPWHCWSMKSIIHKSFSNIFRLYTSSILPQKSHFIQQLGTANYKRKNICQKKVDLKHLKTSQVDNEFVGDCAIDTTEKYGVVVLWKPKMNAGDNQNNYIEYPQYETAYQYMNKRCHYFPVTSDRPWLQPNSIFFFHASQRLNKI